MALKFYLQPNPLTPDPDSQSARVICNRVLDTNAVIKEMLRRGTTVTEADINAVLKVMFEVITDELAEGNSVNLPLVNIRPGITGNFADVTDTFDPARHTRRGLTSPGTMLTQKMAVAAVEKVNKAIASPSLISFTDVHSGMSNNILTPGMIGRLVGENMKFDSVNPAEGVFLIDTDGLAVKAVHIENNTNNKLVFLIPSDLTAGTYSIEVRKGYGTTNIEIRSGVLKKSLTVA